MSDKPDFNLDEWLGPPDPEEEIEERRYKRINNLFGISPKKLKIKKLKETDSEKPLERMAAEGREKEFQIKETTPLITGYAKAVEDAKRRCRRKLAEELEIRVLMHSYFEKGKIITKDYARELLEILRDEGKTVTYESSRELEARLKLSDGQYSDQSIEKRDIETYDNEPTQPEGKCINLNVYKKARRLKRIARERLEKSRERRDNKRYDRDARKLIKEYTKHGQTLKLSQAYGLAKRLRQKDRPMTYTDSQNLSSQKANEGRIHTNIHSAKPEKVAPRYHVTRLSRVDST